MRSRLARRTRSLLAFQLTASSVADRGDFPDCAHVVLWRGLLVYGQTRCELLLLLVVRIAGGRLTVLAHLMPH